MRRMIPALAAVALGGAVEAQVVQVKPLPAPAPPVQIAPAQPGIGIGRPARPVAYYGPTALQKAMQSHLVVSGTVTMEKDPVEVEVYKGSPVKTSYRVATVKVAETLLGDKAETVKVLVPPADPSQVPFDQPFPGRGGPVGEPQYFQPNVSQVQLIDGQEGVFFLQRHPVAADRFTIPYGNLPLNPLDTNYKDDLAAVKKVGAVHADPVKALKAEKAEDRLQAAAVLLGKYRQYPQGVVGQVNQKAIPAEENKLILQALMDADWEMWDKPQQPNEVRDYTLNPSSLLSQMQVYPGGQKGQGGNFPQVRPQPGQGYMAAYKEAFKAWMEADGKTYEIKRFVLPGEKDSGKKEEPKKDGGTEPVKRK